MKIKFLIIFLMFLSNYSEASDNSIKLTCEGDESIWFLSFKMDGTEAKYKRIHYYENNRKREFYQENINSLIENLDIEMFDTFPVYEISPNHVYFRTKRTTGGNGVKRIIINRFQRDDKKTITGSGNYGVSFECVRGFVPKFYKIF